MRLLEAGNNVPAPAAEHSLQQCGRVGITMPRRDRDDVKSQVYREEVLSVIWVISGGALIRIGGPVVPSPRFT